MARAKKKAGDRTALGNGSASNHHHVCVSCIICVAVLFVHVFLSNIQTGVSSKALDTSRKIRNSLQDFNTTHKDLNNNNQELVHPPVLCVVCCVCVCVFVFVCVWKCDGGRRRSF